jgi:hypothetical protein
MPANVEMGLNFAAPILEMLNFGDSLRILEMSANFGDERRAFHMHWNYPPG